jgi:hypothetical protein
VGGHHKRYPEYFSVLEDFTLTASRAPRRRDGHVLGLRWRYTDVEIGDLVKYSPTGVFTVYRAGKIVGQEGVTTMALRSFLRTKWPRRA